MNAYFGTIDENGSIEIRASSKWLRRLKEVAADNVAQHLDCDEDVEILQIPTPLKKLDSL